MAAPTTLKELAALQATQAKSALASALTELNSARTAAAAAAGQHSSAVEALAAADKDLAKVRKKLGEAETEADADALAGELADATLALRAAQAAVQKAETGLAKAKARAEAGAEEYNRWTALAAQAEQQSEKAAEAAGRRKQIADALAAAPLDTLKATATAALGTAPDNASYLAAKARTEADFPEKLRERARERRNACLARAVALEDAAEDAEDLVLAEHKAKRGVDGSVQKARAAFERAETRLCTYALRAQQYYESAVAMLARVADATEDPLTAAQSARIHATTIVNKGAAAAAKEQARDTAAADLDTKRAAYETARLAAIAADVDADPDADAAVVAAQTAVTASETALATAEAALTAAMKKDLDNWEAAVPESAWRRLEDYEEAVRLLTWLKDTDASALASALATAEGALVTALLAADKSERTASALEKEAEEETAAAAFARGAASRDAFLAMRGD